MKTKLGRKVAAEEITSLKAALESGLPLREHEIVDRLLDLEDEVLDVNMVQRMTDSGRRVKFRCQSAVGNGDGYVGLAEAKDSEVGPAIRRSIDRAKLNVIHVNRGCGSWQCRCGGNHTVPMKVTGQAGSIRMTLIPAPRGLGLNAGETAYHVLDLAGIQDVWTFTEGETRTTVNFARAAFNALKRLGTMRGIGRGES
ncbi:MAG: 30S ribosomal protein S5 [Methanonatronarchaeales archaeon]|nr:30S ribosomal protein S5 [Methanonatronarchaeales archaeon]